MRKITLALTVAVGLVALHALAIVAWRGSHAIPFHAGKALLTCPMGYVCPVSPEALTLAVTSPSPKTLVDLAPLLLAVVTVVYANAVERSRRRISVEA